MPKNNILLPDSESRRTVDFFKRLNLEVLGHLAAIDVLLAQMNQLSEEIMKEVEAETSGVAPVRGRRMDAAARRKLSESMKRRWALRKKMQGR